MTTTTSAVGEPVADAVVGEAERAGASSPARRRRRPSMRRVGPGLLLAPAVAIVAVGALGPIAILVAYSFGLLGEKVPAGGAQYQEILGDWYYWEVYLTSIRLALTVTAVALLVGLPIAFAISHSRGWTRTLLVSAIVMPLMVNIVVRNLGWVIVMSRNGLLNQVLDVVGLRQSLPGSLGGIGLVLVHVGIPLIVLPMLTAMDRMDPSEREAALSLGAHPIVAFWRITLPRLASAMVAGSTLVFILAIGSIVTPRFLGQGRVTVAPVLVLQQIATYRWERAAALSMLLFLIVLLYAVVAQRAGGRLTRGRSVRSRGRGALLRPRPVTAAAAVLNGLPVLRRSWTALRRAYLVLALAFLMLPMVVILKSSVDASDSIQVGFDGFTLEWFAEAFSSEGYRAELLFSLRLAVTAVVVALLVSLAASWVLARFSFPGRDGVVAFLMSPLLVPQASLAIGFVLFFLWLGTSPSFERLLFAHLVITVPYMCRMLVTAFESVQRSMEEAALSMGARPLRMFWRVTLPLVRPGLFAALLFGFLVSFDEAAVSVLLASGETTTFPVKLLGAMEFQPTPVGTAVSALLIVVLIVGIVPLERRFGIASNAVGGRRPG
jgi:putative spermidine/putrescine transport system permease protein